MSNEQQSYSRERFLKQMANGLLYGGLTLSGVSSLIHFFRPQRSRSMQSVFDAGLPSDYSINTVSDRYVEEYLTWIGRSDEGFYALKAICTHMSCQPKWKQSSGFFHCPCHDSRFKANGINISGPAPRPLERLKIYLKKGRLKVDRGTVFRHERGEWQNPSSFLEYKG